MASKMHHILLDNIYNTGSSVCLTTSRPMVVEISFNSSLWPSGSLCSLCHSNALTKSHTSVNICGLLLTNFLDLVHFYPFAVGNETEICRRKYVTANWTNQYCLCHHNMQLNMQSFEKLYIRLWHRALHKVYPDNVLVAYLRRSSNAVCSLLCAEYKSQFINENSAY